MSKDRRPETLLPLTTAAFHILVALANEDRHGYGIMQDVSSQTGGALRLGPGTLYGALKRLLADGLIMEVDDAHPSGDVGERRRYYRLTEAGRRVVSAEALRLAAMVRLAEGKNLLPGALVAVLAGASE